MLLLYADGENRTRGCFSEVMCLRYYCVLGVVVVVVSSEPFPWTAWMQCKSLKETGSLAGADAGLG